MEKTQKIMLKEEGSPFGQNSAKVLKSYGVVVKMVAKIGAEVLDNLDTEEPAVL